MYTYQNQNILLGITILYYDKSTINSVVDEMIDLVVRITIAVLLLAILFVYFIGVKFTRPILQITKAAKDVSNGNLDINLNIKTNDEIEHLGEQFNKLVFSLQEHEKMQKFVSTSTMNMIQEDSTCQPLLGGEHRTLTYLFCDIRGFTAMSEKKEPSEVISIVNFYLNLQSNIIKENGGDIDKFIGDEIMASFCGENATQRALHSAIDIQKAIVEANIQRKEKNLTTCEVGIGINHGEVIVGNIGSHERMDFTSIGLTVNLAARLCSFAKAGEIIIEKDTYEISGADCIVKVNTPIVAKGITKPLATYSIIGHGC
jgi:adenylate cyclase